jgi:hypothetical protein
LFKTKVVEEIKTRFLFDNFFRKSYRVWDGVEKYETAISQATDDSAIGRKKILKNTEKHS